MQVLHSVCLDTLMSLRDRVRGSDMWEMLKLEPLLLYIYCRGSSWRLRVTGQDASPTPPWRDCHVHVGGDPGAVPGLWRDYSSLLAEEHLWFLPEELMEMSGLFFWDWCLCDLDLDKLWIREQTTDYCGELHFLSFDSKSFHMVGYVYIMFNSTLRMLVYLSVEYVSSTWSDFNLNMAATKDHTKYLSSLLCITNP